jgi:thiol-disulfide isomerase/thioredoxin
MFKKIEFQLLCIVLVSIANLSLGQNAIVSSRNDTITIKLQRVSGFGPSGNTSFSRGSYEDLKDTADLLTFPAKKNLPPNLSKVSQWLYFIDEFQFYYQNYASGLLSKSLFIKKAAANNWTLSDTINLSVKPLKCAFTILTGIDATGNEMFLVDANNNSDYSDDITRPLLKNVYREDQIVNNAIRVKTNYLENGIIQPNEILVFIQSGRNPQKPEIAVSYPQFDFVRIVYKGTSYLLCAERQHNSKLVCIIPDRPYFTGLGRSTMITPNHFINISGDNFKLVNYDFNKQTVTLTGSPAGFSAYSTLDDGSKAASSPVSGNNIVSDQVGFIAPAITGIDINPITKKTGQVTLSGLRGKYVFVDFWSTYCAPCIAELPYLNAAYKKYSRDKFEIIGVFDERNAKVTGQLLTANKVLFPNVLMNNKSTDISGYGHVDSFPTNYLIDPTGKIIGYNLTHDDLINRLKILINY